MTRSNGIYPFAIEDPDAAPGARSGLRVVVIGAGPVGLAAAAHLLDRGLEPLVLEAGSQVGANILVPGPGPGQRAPARAGRLGRLRP